MDEKYILEKLKNSKNFEVWYAEVAEPIELKEVTGLTDATDPVGLTE
jgi:hypothetical protein